MTTLKDTSQQDSIVTSRRKPFAVYTGWALMAALFIGVCYSFLHYKQLSSGDAILDRRHLQFATVTRGSLRRDISAQGYFNATQIGQLPINLLKNAHESGSDSQSITLEIVEHPDNFRILVADRGTGLSKNALENALLPFYATKQDGSGVGLSLCSEIVEAHGGSFSLSNRAGGGALASVELPKG